MINIGSILNVSDNSGAILVLRINVSKLSSRIGATPGHIITIPVKKNILKKHVIKKSKMIFRKHIYKALIIKTLKGIRRWGHFYIRVLSTNSVVLINMYKLPYATRIIGLILREIRTNISFLRIVSLAQYIL